MPFVPSVDIARGVSLKPSPISGKVGVMPSLRFVVMMCGLYRFSLCSRVKDFSLKPSPAEKGDHAVVDEEIIIQF